MPYALGLVGDVVRPAKAVKNNAPPAIPCQTCRVKHVYKQSFASPPVPASQWCLEGGEEGGKDNPFTLIRICGVYGTMWCVLVRIFFSKGAEVPLG